METSRLLLRGEFDQAASAARQYLKTHPDDSQARILLGRALLAQGNYLGAYSELSRVVHADPKNVDGLYFLGRTAMVLSQLQFQELEQRAPDSYRVHQLLAESYAAQENKVKAEEEYQAALKTAPPSAEILDALADLKREAFQFDEAAGYYQRALETSPQDYNALYGLGACAIFKHNLPKAIEYLRHATRLEPRSASARLALGDALLRDNQTVAAVAELKVAVSIQPDMRQAFSLLARAYAALGQTQLARDSLRREGELARENQQRLERILDTQQGLILVAPETGQKAPRNSLPENHF